MSTYIELEIQNLLRESSDLNGVAERLISYLESHPDNLTRENVTALCRFLLNANLNSVLVHFVLHYLDNHDFPIPWSYFLEALGVMAFEPTDKTIRALLEGIAESEAEEEASRSLRLADKIPALSDWREQRQYKIHQDYLSNKRVLLEQLVTLRTQQLYAQEKKVLSRLQKLYPGDEEVLNEVREHKQRYALDVLQKHAPKTGSIKISDYVQKDPAVEAAMAALMLSLQEQAQVMPEMAFDFAIVAFMLENYETALALLDLCEDSPATIWFRLEVLLRGHRHVELLSDLAKVEMIFSHEAETFFATAYYRAQALWGLGQKHAAIEVLEGLLASRPHYRAASALLSIWSSQ